MAGKGKTSVYRLIYLVRLWSGNGFYMSDDLFPEDTIHNGAVQNGMPKAQAKFPIVDSAH